MTEVIHGLTREQLSGLTFDPTDRMIHKLFVASGKYIIGKDGAVNQSVERDSRSEKGGKNKKGGGGF